MIVRVHGSIPQNPQVVRIDLEPVSTENALSAFP